MSLRNLILIASCLLSSQALALPHLDPEMTGEEYRVLLDNMERQQHFVSHIKDTDPLKVMLEQGKRNLDWINAINSKRDAEHKLELTTPETTRGYPIEQPGFSNRSIIEKKGCRCKKPNAKGNE